MTKPSTPKGPPPPLGNVGITRARIRVQNVETMCWVTLATCLETPNTIAAAAAQVRSEHPSETLTLWYCSGIDGADHWIGQGLTPPPAPRRKKPTAKPPRN